MSLSAEDKITVLQRFVDSYASDLEAVRAVVADASTPAEAQRFLIGGLNYALDMLDIFPDNMKGIGLADDAMVLRLAAKLALKAGATAPVVEKLATDSNLVTAIFEDLAGALETLVAQLPDRDVRGRTATKIMSHKDTRVVFDADISREAKRVHAGPIALREGPERTVTELRKMLDSALKRAGVIK